MSSVIGHGYFQLENPDRESITAVKAILERPCVWGAVYIVGPIRGKEFLYGFLLMDRSATDDEHDEVYEDLGGYCDIMPLYATTAWTTMKCKGKRMVKKTNKEMMRQIDLINPPRGNPT